MTLILGCGVVACTGASAQQAERLRALQQSVEGLRTTVEKRLDAVDTKAAELKRDTASEISAQKARIDDVAARLAGVLDLAPVKAKVAELEAKIPNAPWYASPFLSGFLGAVLGFLATRYFALRAEKRADQQRREDAAIALTAEWRDMTDDVATVAACLAEPEKHLSAKAEHLNIVLGYGNWLELLAQRINRDLVDREYLTAVGMIDRIGAFHRSFADAADKLKHLTPPVDISVHLARWPGMRKLSS